MIKRTLNLSQELGEKSSAFLFGARGVGKTLLCREYLKTLQSHQILEFNLLHNETYERYLKRPHLFRLEVERSLESKKPTLVFVDEVQKIPSLLDEIHSLYEKHQARFLLSGSSARKLRRSGANMLAGRALSLRLHPLTLEETPESLFNTLRLGSLPGVVYQSEHPEQMLRSYVSTYLKEEIQQEALVRQIDAFARFLEVAAQYHGEIINATKVADYAGISSQTVTEYISILEDTLIAWRLPGWSASTTKQLRTTPKLYLFDNGVANALRGEINIELQEGSSRFGKLFEALVIQEVHRFNDYEKKDFKLSYWRTNSDIEIDLILSRGASAPIAAIEIKSSTHPEEKNLRSFERFAVDYPEVPQFCICRCPNPYRIGKVEVLPIAKLRELLSRF